MNAETFHRNLLLAATDEIVSAVIELHCPVDGGWDCQACGPWSDVTRERGWPCSTIDKINQYLNVKR